MKQGSQERVAARVIRLAAVYFALVFAAGFVLGILRVVLLVPKLGGRNAELFEIPIMLAVVYLVGRWIARYARSQSEAYGVGFLSLAMLLVAEICFAAILFQKMPMDALFNRDSVSGGAYFMALLVFAVMPGWVWGNTMAKRANDKK